MSESTRLTMGGPNAGSAGVVVANVALGKAASQSSIDQCSRSQDPAEDARGAVNGEITGGYGFHTGHQPSPWWQVDLGSPHLIGEIVVYNRVDAPGMAERALPLEIQLSDDGGTWRLSHVRQTPFGGKDGEPLRWTAIGREQARLVRLTVPRETCLHLDEVEVYGRPWDPVATAPMPAGMGQTSALARLDAFQTTAPMAGEVAPIDLGSGQEAKAAEPSSHDIEREDTPEMDWSEEERWVEEAQRMTGSGGEKLLSKFRRALFGG